MRPLGTRTAAACALLASLLLASAAAAQGPERTDSYWLDLGLGGGRLGLDCTGCDVSNEEGVTGYLRFGAVLHPQLLVGVQLETWVRQSDEIEQDAQALTALVHVYPLRRRGLWLGGHVGFTRYDEQLGGDMVATHGGAAAASIGWDYWVTPGVALQPSVSYLRQLSGVLEMNGSGLGVDATMHILQIGIGVSWRQP